MKHKSYARLLAVVISFELIVTPVISNVASGANTADIIGAGLSSIGTIWNQLNQGKQPPQMTFDMQQLKQQQNPQPDKYFTAQKLFQIPGLANYLALNKINPSMLECRTLPTTLFELKAEVCRIGVTNDKGMSPEAQQSQMFTYYNEYFQISKLYKNFQSESNSGGQMFGIGCMSNAMNILNGFFKFRIDELDKLVTNLEAIQSKFAKNSEADLMAIKEAVAVLDGESEFADEVKQTKPNLFDYGKRFNNKACLSMFTDTTMNEKGRSGGLNKINADLEQALDTKVGKYSGRSYYDPNSNPTAHTSVVADIESLAGKISKQMELNFSSLSKDPSSYGRFLSELPDLVSSPLGINRAISPDLFSDVRTKFNERYIKLNEEKITILNELNGAGISGDAATTLLGNPAALNFESEVVTIENKLKNKCFESSFNRDTLMSKIYDPNASNHANKSASNYLKVELKRILDDKNSSLKKKMADLEALEKIENAGRYYLKMENKYEVKKLGDQGNLQTTTRNPSDQISPVLFLIDHIENCDTQFKANKLDNKITGAAAIQKLRQLNQDYKTLAKAQSADIGKEVRNRLIHCASPEEANNSVAGSCTPDRFNISSPGFCANAALSCSKNMQECSKQSKGFVKEIKDQKTARVNNYKSMLEKNKQDVIKIFDSALTRYMKDGEQLRGLFGAGFSSPVNIQREVPEGQRYLPQFAQATSKSIDGRLLLENPEKYVEMFKGNIALLKDSVKKQQDQILGGDSTGQGKNTPGLLAQHIKKTENDYKKVSQEADRISSECQNQHDSSVKQAEAQRTKQAEDIGKTNQELGEKLPRFCRKFETARTNPGPACNGQMDDLISAAIKAANMSGSRDKDLKAITEFEELCGSMSNGESNTSNSNSIPRYDWQNLCERLGKENGVYKNQSCVEMAKKSSKECQPIATADGKGSISPCEFDLRNITDSHTALERGTSQVTSVTSSSPSFCSSADSSGRGGATKNMMQTFTDEFLKGISSTQ